MSHLLGACDHPAPIAPSVAARAMTLRTARQFEHCVISHGCSVRSLSAATTTARLRRGPARDELEMIGKLRGAAGRHAKVAAAT